MELQQVRLVGARGFEPPASWSRTRRSSQAEPRPDGGKLLTHHSVRHAVPQPSVLSHAR